MNSALPFALIMGIDHFVAKKLAEELSKKDINVVGVGEYVSGLSEIKNCEWLMDISEVNGKFNYVFDFRGDEEVWRMEQFRGEKVTLICVNDKLRAEQIKNMVKDLDLNWRLVEAEGVYGPGMGEDSFLVEAIRAAVMNKNLTLPDLREKFRILAIDDLVEAILRASFLSGTEREKFLVLGNEINSEEVAKVLIDEAKMTRYKVLQKDIKIEKVDKDKLEESKRKLRWEPRVDFKEGVMETLQYFFSKIDEENRKKTLRQAQGEKNQVVQKIEVMHEEPKVERQERKKNLEVVVEEERQEENNKNEEVLEEIENFYKQKKTKLAVEREGKEITDVKSQSLVVNQKEEKIEEVDEDFESNLVDQLVSSSDGQKKIDKEVDKVQKKNRGKWWGWGILFLTMVLVLVVPINWTISTVVAVNNIKENITLLEGKKYNKVEELSEKNLERIREIDEEIDAWGLNKVKIFRNYQSLLKIGEEALRLEKSAVAMSQSADLISQAIFKDRQINFKEELNKEKEALNNFENQLGLILARLNGDYSWLPAKWRSTLQKKALELKTVKLKVELVSEGMEILPEMLGLDGKKREYMVLFQNEAELRATGGFIGSYGILSFKGGKMLGLEVKDIYEADGQLKGHVEPPAEIKNYLGEANWFMRDANWNADFVRSANDIQWFLDKEMGKKVDGVIGMDMAVARAILGVVGEIYVPDFKEKINSDNLFDQAEFYSENKFFPGSNQKASFLGTLGRQLVEGIKELKVKQQLNLVMAVMDLLEKNEIQLAFNNQETAKLVLTMGWDGSIYQGKCMMENCVADYLMVTESNLGVNKTNYYLNRSMEETVDIGVNSMVRTIKINYENTARENKLPGGDYKNYLRVYLPTDVNILQVSMMDGNSSVDRKTYTSEELKVREVNGKKEVGFLVVVPVMSKKTVVIKYVSEINLTNKNKFSYVNYIQKQPGFGDTGLVTLVSFPGSWQPMQVEPQASVVGGRLLFNQKLDRDIKMGVELGK